MLPGAAPLAFVGSVLQRGACSARSHSLSAGSTQARLYWGGRTASRPPSPRGHTRRVLRGSARPSCLAGGAGTPAGSVGPASSPAPAPPRHARVPGEPGLTRRTRAADWLHGVCAIERPAAAARPPEPPEPPPRGPAAEPRSPARAWSHRPRASEPRGVHGEWGRARARPSGGPPALALAGRPSRGVHPCPCVGAPRILSAPASCSLHAAAALRLPPQLPCFVCGALERVEF